MCVAFLSLDTFVKTLWGVIFYSNSNALFFLPSSSSFITLLSGVFFCVFSFLICRMRRKRRTTKENVKDLFLYQIKFEHTNKKKTHTRIERNSQKYRKKQHLYLIDLLQANTLRSKFTREKSKADRNGK